MISRFEFSTIWLYVYILLFVSALLHTMSTAAALRSPLQMWQQRFWSVPFHVWRFWSIGTDSALRGGGGTQDPVVMLLPTLLLPAPAENHQRADARKTSSREEVDFRQSTERDLGICVPSKMGQFWRVPKSKNFL